MVKNGVILAGGTGSRMRPLSNIYSKQLLFLDGKAVIDYPIQTLVNLGVENITIILGSSFAGQIIDYCGDGSNYNVNLNYIYQQNADGISSAVNLCKRFLIQDDYFYTILGDNIYQNPIKLDKIPHGATIFLAQHKELYRFGVASIQDKQIVKIEEKPKVLNEQYQNYAISGLYLFNNCFFDYFSKTKKSNRNEYEICDIINAYHRKGHLNYHIVDGEWADAGTIDNLKYLNYMLYKRENNL